uniref:Cadherin 17, LI cadherin (liver-intestine) n=1 Tax=Paramormyrops kingsleyae TaxID=1676925 RepID=A0A3B3T0A2_9TELE|nr:cadherin-17 [Paramormyrops kingsleyae]
MAPTAGLLGLTLLFGAVVGLGWEDKAGPLEDKILDVPEGTMEPYPIYQFKSTKPQVTSYRMSGDPDGKFLVSSDGWLYLERALSWSERSHYSLQIEALADSETVDGPYSVTINVIDINNHRPTFNQTEYSGMVREHRAAGLAFMRAFATDLDDPETPNAKLSYSILSQIPDVTKIPLFQIDSVTGEIATTLEGEATLKARDGVMPIGTEDWKSQDILKKKFEEYCSPVKDIPYEFNPFYTCVERSESKRMNPSDSPDYTLIIKVEDLEGKSENALSDHASVSIVVQQNLWFAPKSIRIDENHEGPYPMKIAEVQSNEIGAHYYLSQKERYPSFPFEINEEGHIFVTAALDREEKDMYILVVFARDDLDTDLEEPLEIQVVVEDLNDNKPVCEHLVSQFEVQENEEIGSLIGVLQVYDLDKEKSPNSLLRYEIVDQEPKTPSATMFLIDNFMGKIQLGNSNLQKKEVPEYHLTIKVSDKAGDPTGYSTQCSAVIRVIDINNEIPMFEKNDYGEVTTAEDTELGTTLLSVLATDADDPGTGSSKVVYHIQSGDPDHVFAIDNSETNGQHFGRLYIARPLDFETTSVYTLLIDARNPEPLVKGVEYDNRSTAVVRIQITNVNEPPEFTDDIYEVNVKENVTVGTTLIEMKAEDPEGKDIRFKLEGDERNWLAINPNTGEIKTKAGLDREEVSEYKVRVFAYEKDSPNLQTQRDVNIRLEDVNDNVPKLTATRGFVCANHPQPVILIAEDKDGPPFGQPLTFAMSKKAPNWEIRQTDGTSAKLLLKSAPKEDVTFNIPISIKDNAGLGVPQLFEVRVCNCTQLGYCYIAPAPQEWRLGLPKTIGILAGTLGGVGLLLLIVFYRIRKSDEKKKKAVAQGEGETMLQ